MERPPTEIKGLRALATGERRELSGYGNYITTTTPAEVAGAFHATLQWG